METPFLETLWSDGGFGSVVAGSAFFGAPQSSVQRPQNPCLKGFRLFRAIWGQVSGAPQTPIQRRWIQVRVGFWQDAFFADLIFLSRQIFSLILSPIFSPHFVERRVVEKKVPRKIFQEIDTAKIPDIFLQRGAGQQLPTLGPLILTFAEKKLRNKNQSGKNLQMGDVVGQPYWGYGLDSRCESPGHLGHARGTLESSSFLRKSLLVLTLALKGTNLRGQTEHFGRFSLIFADSRLF